MVIKYNSSVTLVVGGVMRGRDPELTHVAWSDSSERTTHIACWSNTGVIPPSGHTSPGVKLTPPRGKKPQH
jgi:hypothetical protein